MYSDKKTGMQPGVECIRRNTGVSTREISRERSEGLIDRKPFETVTCSPLSIIFRPTSFFRTRRRSRFSSSTAGTETTVTTPLSVLEIVDTVIIRFVSGEKPPGQVVVVTTKPLT